MRMTIRVLAISALAAPDGYTLLMSDTTFGIIPGLYAKLPYDAPRDFAPITQVSSMPSALVVHPSLAANSVKELIAVAEAKPGALNFGSGAVVKAAGVKAEF